MPPATYEAALADPGFLSMLGAIYQQANQFEVAQGLLERSVELADAGGRPPTIALQIQLAAIYLQRNNTAQAYAIYQAGAGGQSGQRRRLEGPDRRAAGDQSQHRGAPGDRARFPRRCAAARCRIEFVQTEASLYAAAGDMPQRAHYINRVQAHYASCTAAIRRDIEIQSAWLLYNTRNDRALYPDLMRLGAAPT